MVAGTSDQPRPGQFCRFLLKALEAAEGQTRRRKRDQAPDRLGLGVKRQLLQQAAAADPDPDAFEAWLVAQIAAAPAAGAVRAMCEQIFIEYRMATLRPEFADWLAEGAPSEDAERPAGARGRGGQDRSYQHERWQGRDEIDIACTCHLPQP